MEYGGDTVLVAGTAKAGTENPITAMYNHFILILILEKSTGKIIDAEINSVCRITNEFVRAILVGRNLYYELDQICEQVNTRYMGSSKKAIVNCLKDAKNRAAMGSDEAKNT